jgi:ABC-type sugar transport system substrate-binding protein
MFKKFLTVVVLVVLALSLVVTNSSFGSQPVKAQGKTYKIALSVPGLNFPFFVIMAKQFQDEAKKLGDVTVDVLDGRDDTAKQTADLESVIALKYDGLVVSPRDANAMQPAVKAVSDAKIPVITVDRKLNDATVSMAHVGADNVQGGKEQGWYIMKLFPKGATIFNLTGTPGASPAIDRAKGLHDVLDPHPEYKIVAEQTGNFTRDGGNKVAEAMLAAQPNPPDVINAANDDMALGVIEALRGKSLNGKVTVIGFDAITESLQAIIKGDQTADIDQFPGAQSATALDMLEAFLTKGTKPAQHDTFLPPVLIDKNNLPCAAFFGDLMSAMATQAAASGATPMAMPTVDKSMCAPLAAPTAAAK